MLCQGSVPILTRLPHKGTSLEFLVPKVLKVPELSPTLLHQRSELQLLTLSWMEAISALYSGDAGSVLVKFSLMIVKPRSYAVSGARVGGSDWLVGLGDRENPERSFNTNIYIITKILSL